MSKPKIICKILKIGLSTYYKYKKEGVKIVQFLQNFKIEELRELEQTGQITRIAQTIKLYDEIIESKKIEYLHNFEKQPLKEMDDYFISFYFQFLLELKKAALGQKTIDNNIFNHFFYLVNFRELFLSFFTFFNLHYQKYFTQHTLIIKTHIISRYSEISFKNWDKYMLFFLSNELENNLKILYNPPDDIKDKTEAIYHIIGLYVFQDSNIPAEQKLDAVNSLFSKYQNLPSPAKISNQPYFRK